MNLRLTEGDASRLFLKSPKNKIKHAKFGTLSYVNNGHDLHGSQVGQSDALHLC